MKVAVKKPATVGEAVDEQSRLRYRAAVFSHIVEDLGSYLQPDIGDPRQLLASGATDPTVPPGIIQDIISELCTVAIECHEQANRLREYPIAPPRPAKVLPTPHRQAGKKP